MKYEFYIYTEHGEDTWHWGINRWRDVQRNILEYKHDKSFSIEVQRWHGEGDFDFIEVYPKDDSKYLPLYIQEKVKRALQGSK